MPTAVHVTAADVSLMTKQAPSALADAASHSEADTAHVTTADVSFMTKQAPSALADAASHSAADASAIAPTDATVPIVPEGDFSS